MGKHIFRIDNKGQLYKKLIKLPTAYYRLEENGNVHTVHSHVGTVEVGNINDLKLKKQGDEIVLCTEDLPLKLNGEDFVIEQEAITGRYQENIIKQLKSGEEALISRKDIKNSDNFAAEFIIGDDDGTELVGMLSFIDFNDENDPVLQMIKKETGGLYFTIEDDSIIYISDTKGNCLPVCVDGSCYKYQHTKNECDTLEISEISKVIESLTNAEQKCIGDFTLQKGKELSDDKYEANICLDNRPVATLPQIGYYMFDDQLVMRNHVTKETVAIPREFHFLKVVKGSSDNYKLTFCNAHGNEFFEHKKYDPQYSHVSDEYKSISLNCVKKNYNLNFGELFSHQPSFFIKKGPVEPGSPDHYRADVCELTNSRKGKAIATLIDEFGYFDKSSKFQYRDYHKEAGYDINGPVAVKNKYMPTKESSEFYLEGDSDITLHTIPELF